MTSYRNQKIITIQKAVSNKNNLYAIFNLAATKQAMKELSSVGFVLYSYLNLNQNNYTLALSKVDFMNKTGLSENTYLRGVRELIEKGFLVKTDDDTNKYLFYENPNPSVAKPDTDIVNIPKVIAYKPTHSDKTQLTQLIEDIKNGDITITRLQEVLLEVNYSEDAINWYVAEINKAISP